MSNKAKIRNFNFFDAFINASKYSEEVAIFLRELMTSYDPDTLEQKLDEMHEIEQAADVEKHELHNALARTFMTPIEREDIMLLSQILDDVTDNIEDVGLRLFMFNIDTIRKDALEFVDLILKCCEAMTIALEGFHDFRRSSKITPKIIEINRLEEVGDKLYSKAVRDLYTHSESPIHIIAWSQIYDRLEKCCDSIEHVANQIESIMMKNS